MTNFDTDEKIITDALNELNANLVIPDLMPGIKRKLDSGATQKPKRKAKRLIISMAAAVAVLTFSTTVIAGLDPFDWLKTKANPPFASIIKPVEPLSTTSE